MEQIGTTLQSISTKAGCWYTPLTGLDSKPAWPLRGRNSSVLSLAGRKHSASQSVAPTPGSAYADGLASSSSMDCIASPLSMT